MLSARLDFLIKEFMVGSITDAGVEELKENLSFIASPPPTASFEQKMQAHAASQLLMAISVLRASVDKVQKLVGSHE